VLERLRRGASQSGAPAPTAEEREYLLVEHAHALARLTPYALVCVLLLLPDPRAARQRQEKPGAGAVHRATSRRAARSPRIGSIDPAARFLLRPAREGHAGPARGHPAGRYAGGVIQGNTDGDLAIELEIQLTGAPVLVVNPAFPGTTDILL
jgi:hypothetical protein